MFRQLECNPSTLALFDRKDAHFISAVRFEMENRLPMVKFSLFSYETKDSTYFYGYKEHKTTQAHVVITYKGTFDEESFAEGFEQFQKAVKLFEPVRQVITMGSDVLMQAAYKCVKRKNFSVNYRLNPCSEFVITEENEHQILSMPLPKLPPGYEIGNADPNDCEFITGYWKYADEGEVENTRFKLECLPSSCIRYEGKPVGFEMLGVDGGLNHQYVLEEHRRKGLGAALEIDILQKCLKEGLIMFKNVENSNIPVVSASRKASYWTIAKKSDGSDYVKTYFQLTLK